MKIFPFRALPNVFHSIRKKYGLAEAEILSKTTCCDDGKITDRYLR